MCNTSVVHDAIVRNSNAMITNAYRLIDIDIDLVAVKAAYCSGFNLLCDVSI